MGVRHSHDHVLCFSKVKCKLWSGSVWICNTHFRRSWIGMRITSKMYRIETMCKLKIIPNMKYGELKGAELKMWVFQNAMNWINHALDRTWACAETFFLASSSFEFGLKSHISQMAECQAHFERIKHALLSLDNPSTAPKYIATNVTSSEISASGCNQI